MNAPLGLHDWMAEVLFAETDRVRRPAYVSRRMVVPPGSLIASHVDEAGRDTTS